MGERSNQHARREKRKPNCDLGKITDQELATTWLPGQLSSKLTLEDAKGVEAVMSKQAGLQHDPFDTTTWQYCQAKMSENKIPAKVSLASRLEKA